MTLFPGVRGAGLDRYASRLDLTLRLQHSHSHTWRRFSSRSPLSARRTLEGLVTLGYSHLARAPE